jgi:hypothetical protein
MLLSNSTCTTTPRLSREVNALERLVGLGPFFFFFVSQPKKR